MQVLRGEFGETRLGRVDEQTDDGRWGHQLMQQLEPLRLYLRVQRSYACDVAARSREAGDQSKLDRIGRYLEDDRNRRCRPLGCQCRRSAARRDNYGHLTTDEIGRQWR